MNLPVPEAWWRRTGWRLSLLAVLLLGVNGLLLARHLQLILLPADQVHRMATRLPLQVRDVQAFRGTFKDRNDYPLAVSLPVETLALDTGLFANTDSDWRRLAEVVELDVEAARRRLLAHPDSHVIFLRRHLDADTASRVRALNMAGVLLEQEAKRYYPTGEMLAPVLGLADVDGRGQEGLEAVFDDMLSPTDGRRAAWRDPRGRPLRPEHLLKEPKDGVDVRLTIDADMQYLAYSALKKAILSNGAVAGSLVVADIASGDLLALSSYPSYNPNDRRVLKVQRNRPAMDQLEPGSIFKPFTVAAALSTDRWQSDSAVDTDPGFVTLDDGTRFVDTKNHGQMDVAKVLVRSSQVGAVKLALDLRPEELTGTLRNFGFGTMTGVGLPAEADGFVPSAHHLKEVRQANLGFGYGCTVTALQLVRAYSALGNGGVLMPLRLVQGLSGPEPVSAVSPQVAKQVLAMLEDVVRQGTGQRAQIKGYRVAGKTGTVHLATAEGYAPDRYRSLFAGLVPVSKPRLAIVVVIEEPNPNRYFGGQVAAPVFAEVAKQLLFQLAVAPDAPDAPGVRDAHGGI